MERLLNDIRHASHRLVLGGILSLIILLLLSGSYLRWLDIYELDTLDLRFRLRPPIPKTDRAVIIEIGDDTIVQLGHFPIDRSYHALLIKALADAGAKAIVFDIFFSEPHPSDDELADAIKNAGNVYLPYIFEIHEKGKENIISASGFVAQTLETLTAEAKGTGHINIIPDRDGKYRRVPLYIEYNNTFYPYLSFLVGCDLLGVPGKAITLQSGREMKYGQHRIPLDEHSTMLINFSGKWEKSYAHYSYVDVLRSYIAKFSGEVPLLDLNIFKNKICFIGLTAEGTSDLHPNPFESLYPSVGIHAEVLNSMLNKTFISRVSKSINLIFLLVLILLTGIAVWWTKPLKALIFVGLMIAIFIFLSAILFDILGLWIDLFYPVVCVFLVYLLCISAKSVLEWKKRLVLENELKIARQIQESFLPKTLPQTGRLEIAARMLTARQVGGDLYDCFVLEDGKLGVMIGDVTGKGIPASLFMAMVVASFRFYVAPVVCPEETLRQLNEKLIKEVTSGLFVTLCYAVFDMQKGMVSYANGGHLPILYIPKEHSPQFLDVEDGFPLGMIIGKYSEKSLSFAKGDLFIFYTDGITEARNARSEMYGSERLKMLVEQHRQRSIADLIKIIEEDVRSFEPYHSQHDDITYLVLKVT